MNVSLDLYRIFYIVAKNKHMTKASMELNISQPAISQSIKKLEEQLGGSLFLRSNKGMELTEEGKMFYQYIEKALDFINDAEVEFTNFKDLTKGKINIGASTTLTKIFLLDAIEIFHKKYPEIDINVINGLTNDLIVDLQNGKLDLVIFNDNTISNPNLKLRSLKKIRQGFIYNDAYFNDNINSFSDLNNFPLILQNNGSNSRQFLDIFLLKKGLVLKPKTEVVSQELITEFVNIGLGIGFTIIDLACKNYPNLKELKINKDIPSIDVFLVTNEHLTFACGEFVNILFTQLKN